MSVEDTLNQREQQYGSFEEVATLSQRIKTVIRGDMDLWGLLPDTQKESLEMIATKVARILNGDNNYRDSWHDIAGYAALIADKLVDLELTPGGSGEAYDTAIKELAGDVAQVIGATPDVPKGKRWTAQEDQLLIDATIKNALTNKEIATKLGRDTVAVINRKYALYKEGRLTKGPLKRKRYDIKNDGLGNFLQD